MLFLKNGSDTLFIGRPRRHGLRAAREHLGHIAKGEGGMAYLRTVLAEEMANGALAKMGDAEVIEALATRVDRGQLTLIARRPLNVDIPPMIIEAPPPPAPEPPPPEKKPEEDWIEVVLMDDNDPPQPVAGAAYRLELEDGRVIEGYLDNDGKARVDGVPKGIKAKVSFPEYDEPVAEGDVEVEEEKQEAAPPPPVAVKECEISSMVVECEHAAKRKKITLPAAANAGKDANVLEVVGADKGRGDKIKTALELAKPRCAEHAGKAIEVKRPAGDTVLFAEDTATFEAYHQPVDLGTAKFWPWDDLPDVYEIKPIGCRGASDKKAVVRVYPALKPSVSAKITLNGDGLENGIEDRVNAQRDKAKQLGRVEKRGRPPHTEWGFEFHAKMQYGTHARDIGAEFQDKIRAWSSANRTIKRSIDWAAENCYKYIGIVLLPEYPNLELRYEGEFKEIDGSTKVGAEWSLMFKADPLIGLTVKIEILEVLIHALKLIPQVAPIAAFLEKVREWAKANDQTLELFIAFSGLIAGEVGIKKAADAAKAKPQGMVEGKLKVAFSAKAELGSQSIVSFKFGAEVGGDTGIAARLEGATDDQGAYLQGKLVGLACKFQWSAWASGKFIWEIKESYEDEYTWWEETDLRESNKMYIMKRA